ncbi:hypothetical protein AB205_0057300 [Aquarana catesbeiana]|uniref:TatD DNase domain containing 3 n=1 Tax=Aquarana catesbeiana TaxID=8400 RepID=A0A2G9R643_AQUCT|nr:hypothetical protein AB205_0057300 [Aquarana catesbeiana]
MEGGAGGWGGACAVRVHAELETDRCLEVLARGAGMELNGGMVDCHCHLSAAEFNQDIDNILQEARTAGVRALVAVAEHAAEFEKLIQLSRRSAPSANGNLRATTQCHPSASRAERQNL